MIRKLIDKIVRRQDLAQAEAQAGMEFIMRGEATPAQIAAFITALRMKGETAEEITGCAQAMRNLAIRIRIKGPAVGIESDGLNQADENLEGKIVDTCGTGGDGSQTFNISTAVAFVAAGQGLIVAKHGNRAISSSCGSADVLERLGVNLKLTPEQVQQCIEQVGIGFLFAPVYHLAMKHAALPRREIGIRTIFNLLGPLANPAGANVQVVGVYEKSLTEKMAQVLGHLGTKHAMVVHGAGCLDEFSMLGSTQVSEYQQGQVKTYSVTPADFDLEIVGPEALAGGDADQNAQILRDIFNGQTGPKLDAVVMNAAAVFVVAGMAGNFKQGAELARQSVRDGKAKQKLEALVALSQQLGGEGN